MDQHSETANPAPTTGSAETDRDLRPQETPGTATTRPPQQQLKLAFARIAVILAVVFTIRYFYWRVRHTMNPAAKWFFYLFLVAEALNFLESVLFYFTAWSPTRYRRPQPLPDRAVDVFITTFNEPLDLLLETAVCAVSIQYQHKTYILDDGNRPEVAQLAQELGCEYFSRSDRTDAKAGNLNHALARTSGEFILVLDADHVPGP
ncbi:MAG: glycosyltransferase, partial [Terriglobales bacterium]